MTPRINPIAPRLHWDVLSSSDIERIHEATLDGPRRRRHPLSLAPGRSTSSRRTAARSTARAQIVKLPRKVVMEAVAQVPGQYLLAGRDPDCDMIIDRRALLPVQRRQRRVRLRPPHRRQAPLAPRPTPPPRRASSTRCPTSATTGARSSPARTCRRRPRRCTTPRPCSPTRASTIQAVTTVGEKSGAAAGRDGGRHRRRHRRAAAPADHQLHAVRRRPAGPRRPQPRGQPGGRRARSGQRLHAHAADGRHRPGHAGRQPRRAERRGAVGRRAARARLPRLPGVLCRRAQRDGPEDRRLHGGARGLPAGRRRHPARPLLRRADGHGHHGHERQGARLAGGRRRLAVDLRQRHDLRRHDERLRAAERLQDPELPAHDHGDRDLRHRAEGGRRRRWSTTRRWRVDLIAKVGRQRHLPRREAHPPAHEGDLAADRLGPHALRRLACRRQGGRSRQGHRHRRRHPRQLPVRAAARSRRRRDRAIVARADAELAAG